MYHILAGILFICVVCPAHSQDRTNSPHFILEYIAKIDSLSGEIDCEYCPEMKVSFEQLHEYDTTDHLLRHLKGKRPALPFNFFMNGTRVSYPENVFFDIAKKYKDTCYNKQRHFPWRPHADRPVVNDTLLTFHVVCDRDYDPLHPQGTYLDDLVAISYERQVFNPSRHYNKTNSLYSVLLTDYNKDEEHSFLFPRVDWGLIKPPQKEGVFTFTFIVTDERGRVHKIKYQPVRLKKETGIVETYY